MSEGLGFVRLEQGDEPFLGRDLARPKVYADGTAAKIDGEVRRILARALEGSGEILTAHQSALDRMAAALLEQETLDADAIADLLTEVPTWRRSGGLQQVVPPDLVKAPDLAV